MSANKFHDSMTVIETQSRQWPPLEKRSLGEVIRTEGHELVLRSGRRVLDATGGAGAAVIGYGRLEVLRAQREVLSLRSHVLSGFSTPERSQLVGLLHDQWLPRYMSALHFANSGSEAYDLSVILARQCQMVRGQTNRWRVIGRDKSYHGSSVAGLAAGGHDYRREGLGPLVGQQPRLPVCDCKRCPLKLQPSTCETRCAEILEEIIQRLGADSVAAFIAEPVVGASGGALVPPDEYWPIIRKICNRYGILLIADEVMCGFGRSGYHFAIDAWQVEPDMMLLGKGISGGYGPLGAVAVHENVVADLSRCSLPLPNHTTAAHPSVCAASVAVLKVLQRERLVSRVSELGPRFGQILRRHLQQHRLVKEIRGVGFLWAVVLRRDREASAPLAESEDIARQVVEVGFREGVLFYPGGTERGRNIVLLSPPLTYSMSEADLTASVLRRALDQI